MNPAPPPLDAARIPLSLYLHFPWCVRKCPYCDFNSHEAKGEVPEQQYLDALRADLEMALPLIWGRKIHTVFIGGGTPSLMSAAGLDRLLSDVRTLLPLDSDVEITMEANPGTFEAEKFKAEGRTQVVRLKMHREGKCVFDDQVRGHCEFDWDKEQDHVIQRADGPYLRY